MNALPSVSWVESAAAILTPIRRAGVLEEALDGEAILYDEANGRTYCLNESSLLVWNCCDGQRTTRDVATELTSQYEIEFAKALDHVEQLLVLFAEAGLITASDEHGQRF